MVKRGAELSADGGPVSAFAARKAVQNPLRISKDKDTPDPPTINAVGPVRNEIKALHTIPNPESVSVPSKKRKIETRVDGPETPSDSTVNGQNAKDNVTCIATSNIPATISEPDSSTDYQASHDGAIIIEDDSEASKSSIESETVVQTIPSRQLSTFVMSKDNVLGDVYAEWTVRLKENDTLTLIGQYDIWVRTGAISIMGAVLHASSQLYRIYAPSTHSLPCIRYSRNPYGPEYQPAEITLVSCTTRIRLLRRVSTMFGRIWNHKGTQARNTVQSAHLSRRPFSFITSSAEDPYKRPLTVLEPFPDWQTLATKLLTAAITELKAIMICGPKSSGKSTFARLLTNAFLTKAASSTGSNKHSKYDGIALLDLDLGQPEFSPPGEISLVHLRSYNFGPPFTHPIVPPAAGDRVVRAHHIGAVTPRDDPSHYVRCAIDLLGHYRRMLSTYPTCPLIVNCSGWVLGSGLEILEELIRCLTLTDVIYMSTTGPEEVAESLEVAANRTRTLFHTLTSQSSEYVTRTAADLRTMQTLSYLHMDDPEEGALRWVPSPINTAEPVDLHYAGPDQGMFCIMKLGEELDPDVLSDLLEGSMVGIVAIEDDSALMLDGVTSDQVKDTLDIRAPIAMEEDSLAQIQPNLVDGEDSDEEPEQNSRGSDQAYISPTPDSDSRRFEHCTSIPLSQHPLVPCTRHEGLPFLFVGVGTCIPLDPSKSRSLGQAFVRCIDKESKVVRLITPISQQVFNSHRQKNIKIVLVRGKLDLPTWAYQEECAAAIAASKQKSQETKQKDGYDSADNDDYEEAFDIEAWAKDIPWAKVVTGRARKHRKDRVWKVRRNLTTRKAVTDLALSD